MRINKGIYFLLVLLLLGLLVSTVYAAEESDVKEWVEAAMKATNLALSVDRMLIAVISIMLAVLGFLGFKEYFNSRGTTARITEEFEKLKKERVELINQADINYKIISAKVFYAQKQYDEAFHSLADVPDKFSYEVPLYRGLIHYFFGDYTDAHDSYDKALQLPNCDKARIYYNKGNVFLKQTIYDEAILEYDKALKINSGHIRAHNNMAIALRHAGYIKKAITLLKKTVNKDKTYARSSYNLACYFALTKDTKQALHHLGVAIDTEKDAHAKKHRIDMARKDPDFSPIDSKAFSSLLNQKEKELKKPLT